MASDIAIAVNRLRKELQKIQKNPPPHIVAMPDEKAPLEWHFVIFGIPDSVYSRGFYHGKIFFPTNYPFKPPDIVFLTPNGRFKTQIKICMSFTGYHPESFTPNWTVEAMLMGLISFMNTEEQTYGSERKTPEQRKELAELSLLHNIDKTPEFIQLFEPQFANMGITAEEISQRRSKRENKSQANKQDGNLGINEMQMNREEFNQNLLRNDEDEETKKRKRRLVLTVFLLLFFFLAVFLLVFLSP